MPKKIPFPKVVYCIQTSYDGEENELQFTDSMEEVDIAMAEGHEIKEYFYRRLPKPEKKKRG